MTHTDPGSQHPKERFREGIATLGNRASISLVARNEAGSIVGVCFGITDFACWLLITDLGVIRECAGQGIGTALFRKLPGLSPVKQAAGTVEPAPPEIVPSLFCNSIKNSHVLTDMGVFWSRVRESNPPSRLGKHKSVFYFIFTES